MSGVETGANSPLWYKWEDGGFTADPTGSAIPLGPGATLDTNEGSNNAVRVMAPDNKEAADIIAQNFDGSYSFSFTLADPWFLAMVFGQPTTEGTGPYTHTYDGDSPESVQLVEGYRGSGMKRKLRGCVPRTVRINTQVPQQVQVTVNGAYADENNPTETIEAQPDYDYRPMKFSEARLDLEGTKEQYVQNASLTITVNPQLVDALDSRTSVDFWTGVREPDLDYSKLMDKNAGPGPDLEDFYGSAGATSPQDAVTSDAPLTMEFASAVDTNTLTFNLGGGFPNTYSETGVGDPTQALQEDLNRMVKTVDAVAENGTETAP